MKKYEIKSLKDKQDELIKEENKKYIIDPKLSDKLDKIFNSIDTKLDVSYKLYGNSIILKDNGEEFNNMSKVKLDEILRKIKTAHYLHYQNKFTETANLDYNIDMSRFNTILADANKYIISYISPNHVSENTIFTY